MLFPVLLAPPTHRKPISITRLAPPPTGYTRIKRTARFSVNTRESASYRDARRRPEIDRFLHAEDIISTSIIATVTLESDGSYSICIQDANAPEDSDMRYITGLSEGREYDSIRAGLLAGQLIADQADALVQMLNRGDRRLSESDSSLRFSTD